MMFERKSSELSKERAPNCDVQGGRMEQVLATDEMKI